MLDIHGKACIHSYITPDKCGLPTVRQAHGLLCSRHYQRQEEVLPKKPRLPQPRWKGLVPQSDDVIIADILATDATAIALGRVVTIQRGALDPVFLHILEPPSVH